jgi:hypothetical protein
MIAKSAVVCDASEGPPDMTITEAKNDAMDAVTDTASAAKNAGSDLIGGTRSAVGQVRDGVGDAMSHVPAALDSAKSGVDQVAERMPAAVETTRIAAIRTNTQLQTLPEQTLRMIAVGSIGLSAGLSMARAPRIVAFAALVPALFVGGALATRPRNDFGSH